MISKPRWLLIACTATMLGASAAQAGVYQDDLGRCLVNRSSDPDKVDMVRWIFSSISLNRAVAPLAAISQSERQMVNARAGVLITRLLTEDCRKELVAAVKYEGSSSLQGAFEVLGRASMAGLMADASVQTALGDSMKIDEEKLAAVFAEAGIKPSAQPPAK